MRRDQHQCSPGMRPLAAAATPSMEQRRQRASARSCHCCGCASSRGSRSPAAPALSPAGSAQPYIAAACQCIGCADGWGCALDTRGPSEQGVLAIAAQSSCQRPRRTAEAQDMGSLRHLGRWGGGGGGREGGCTWRALRLAGGSCCMMTVPRNGASVPAAMNSGSSLRSCRHVKLQHELSIGACTLVHRTGIASCRTLHNQHSPASQSCKVQKHDDQFLECMCLRRSRGCPLVSQQRLLQGAQVLQQGGCNHHVRHGGGRHHQPSLCPQHAAQPI